MTSECQTCAKVNLDVEQVAAKLAAQIGGKFVCRECGRTYERHQCQAAELAKWKALAETLAGALGEAVTWNSHDDEGVPAVWLGRAEQALTRYKEARDAS